MNRWPDPRRCCYYSEAPCEVRSVSNNNNPNQLLLDDHPRTNLRTYVRTCILHEFWNNNTQDFLLRKSLSRHANLQIHAAGKSDVAAAALPHTRTHLPLCERIIFSLMTITTLQVPSGGTALSFVPAVLSAYCASLLLLLENPERFAQPSSSFRLAKAIECCYCCILS
ncbi:unnamed protein product, partial [Ectocarpus sp. 6 AP-2014]